MITDDSILDMDKMSSIPLKAIPGTMMIHQVISHRSTMKPNAVRTRHLSCFCTKTMDSSSFNAKDATFILPPLQPIAPQQDVSQASVPEQEENELHDIQMYPLTHGNADIDIIGKWCVVVYDKIPYPGIIQDIDLDSVELKAMHKVGINRFFWPMLEDIIWYDYEQVLMFVPEPEHVTKRHVQIRPDIWSKITARGT